MSRIHQTQIKIIGQNGQLTLGKNYAGKMVSVDYDDDTHVWVIKAGEFIPESQKWLHTGDNLSKLNRALEWAKEHEPCDNFEQFAQEVEKCSK